VSWGQQVQSVLGTTGAWLGDNRCKVSWGQQVLGLGTTGAKCPGDNRCKVSWGQQVQSVLGTTGAWLGDNRCKVSWGQQVLGLGTTGAKCPGDNRCKVSWGQQVQSVLGTTGAGVSINHCIPKELAEGMECLKMATPANPACSNQQDARKAQAHKPSKAQMPQHLVHTSCRHQTHGISNNHSELPLGNIFSGNNERESTSKRQKHPKSLENAWSASPPPKLRFATIRSWNLPISVANVG
jgi:hypothetical protein